MKDGKCEHHVRSDSGGETWIDDKGYVLNKQTTPAFSPCPFCCKPSVKDEAPELSPCCNAPIEYVSNDDDEGHSFHCTKCFHFVREDTRP